MVICRVCVSDYTLYVSFFCSSEVTHVVTEFETREQAIRHLDIPDSIPEHLPEFLNTTWFSDSLRAKKLVDIQDSHRLSSFGSVEEVIHVMFVKNCVTVY